MIVLGIDSAPKGLAIVSIGENVESLFIKREKNFDATLLKFFDSCQDIAADTVFIEDVTYVRNVKATLMSAAVLTAAKLAFGKREIPIFTVNNMTWKAQIIGNGKADKETIKKFVLASSHFNFDKNITDDIADAACIALFGKIRMQKL